MAGPYAIGVDVGGTKILAGVVDCATGEVVGLSKVESPDGGGGRGRGGAAGASPRRWPRRPARTPPSGAASAWRWPGRWTARAACCCPRPTWAAA